MNDQKRHGEITKALWMHTAYISRKLDNSLGTIHGIGLTEYMVLLNLVNAPDNTLRRIDIADAIGRTASGITRMLLPMEKIGLVKKESNPRDARVSLVKITAAGKKIHDEATDTFNQISEQLLNNIHQSKLDDLLSLLSSIHSKA